MVKTGKNRHHLADCDLQFIQARLTDHPSQSTHFLKLVADPGSVDVILDSPLLHQELMDHPGTLHLSAFLYFYILLRKALLEAGIDDRGLADYVASVLADQAHTVRTKSDGGLPVDMNYGVDFLRTIHSSVGYRRFAVCVVAGDRFLFLTGLFPEFLARREQRWGAPGLNYYEEFGRNFYRMARDHPLAQEFAMQEVYDSLTSGFKQTRLVLNDLAQRFIVLD